MGKSYGATICTDSTTKNVLSIILNGIECATFGHGDLDKDVSEPKYSILSSTFGGETILSIFNWLKQKRILQYNILTLNNNYQFIRNNNGWCIGIVINGLEYY